TGSWKWINESEILILSKSMLTNNNELELAGDHMGYHLRVVELNKENLIVVKKHMNDTENSLAGEITYLACAK
ncbi:MAG TPA: hypothetical protein VK666_04920, partial [Chryseolinea sp.]|nr:hypothetical protein [Chryseolinea sp.]